MGRIGCNKRNFVGYSRHWRLGPIVMSTTDTYPITECEQCDEPFELGYNQEYCSEECLYRSRGESILNLLKHDHRLCHGCFEKLKEVERPTDEQLRHVQGRHSADSIIGFQYRTPEADTGELTIHARDDRKEVVGTGVICGSCGTTDHRDSFQRDFEPIQAAKRLRERVRETREEGQHSKYFDTKAFVNTWNENPGEWELALGKALEST